MVDVNFLVLIISAIIVALAYGILGLFAAKVTTGESFDLAKFLATVVYSIVIGVIATLTGVINFDTIANWQALFSPIWTQYILIYMGLLYGFQKLVVPVASRFASKSIIYPIKDAAAKLAAGIRKMDAESRKFLVFDLPNALQAPTLAAVDAAEAANNGAGTYQYAIESGAWIFLIEGGELAGAKHYYFKAWFGTSVVSWKPISDACFSAIRKTGKFPDYNKLY
jgi:hypothetical protein